MTVSLLPNIPCRRGTADLGVACPLPGPLEELSSGWEGQAIILQVRPGSSDGVPITSQLDLLWQEGEWLLQNSTGGALTLSWHTMKQEVHILPSVPLSDLPVTMAASKAWGCN